jgi:hypothetical protein
MWKETVMDSFKDHPRICLEGLSKATNNLSEVSRYPAGRHQSARQKHCSMRQAVRSQEYLCPLYPSLAYYRSFP